MIEVSITEIVLFAWAIIATGYALKYKQVKHQSDVFIHTLLENKELRDELVADYEQFQRGQS
mgnify:CR=1 FL=1